MKSVRTFVFTMMLALTLIFTFALTACSSDDDEGYDDSALRASIAELQAANEDLEDAVEALQTADTASATTIAQLQALITQMQTRLTAIEGDTAELDDIKADLATAEAAIADLLAQLNQVSNVVTFRANNGTAATSKRIVLNQTVEEPARPAKTGEVFVGWYTDEATEEYMWDFAHDKVVVPTTLYAKYVTVDATHLLLNAYATAAELESPYVAATLQTLGAISDNQRELTLTDGTVVYIAPGVYWTDQTYKNKGDVIDGLCGLKVLGSNVSFIGLTEDAYDVHICGNRGEGGASGLGASGNWDAIGISTGFAGKNVTFANYAQQDLVYPRDPSQNIEKRIDSRNHAQVMTGNGALDKLVFENARFIGYLNMMAGVSPTRGYFKDCYIQCTDDSIFSGGVIVYETCTFSFFGNHPSWGAASTISVLLGCKGIGHSSIDPTFYFSKQGNGTGGVFAVIDTVFSSKIAAVEWENFVREDIRHFVYNNKVVVDGVEQPITISPSQAQTSVTLTADALKAFKVGNTYNVYNLLKGSDGWNPSNQDLTALGANANLPYKFEISATGKTMYSDASDATNQAVLTPAVNPSDTVTAADYDWDYDETLLEGNVDNATGVLTLTAKANNTGAIIKTTVTATLPDGLNAGATLYIRPVPVPAPIVSTDGADAPAIAITEDTATLSYTLDHAEYTDTSVIDWYRETGAATTNGVHIATSRNDTPYKAYQLSKDDIGFYLRAVITPDYEFSAPSDTTVTVYTARAITTDDVTSDDINTTFANTVLNNEDATTTGRWFFEGPATPWAWGIGTSGVADRWGLMNNRKVSSTRLVYNQSGDYTDMSFTVDMSTSKTAGQGFGGNGQYFDVIVKYDAVAKTGYGLRVTRTAASSCGTTWALYKFDNATMTMLGDSVLSGAFMPNSTITVSVTGNVLRVQASTESELTENQSNAGMTNVVDISWTDESGDLAANTSGSFCICCENTGDSSTTPGNAGTNNCLMIHEVTVSATEKVVTP